MRWDFSTYLHALFILAAVAVTGCDVHEFPKVAVPQPPAVDRTLTLVFDDTDFDHYRTVEIGGDGRSRAHSASPSHDMRYIVRAYKIEPAGLSSSRVASRAVFNFYEGTAGDYGSHPDLSLPLDLDEGEYDILAWAEHVPAGSATDFYYDTSDFYELTLNGIDSDCYSHHGNDPFREAWRGLVHLSVARDGKVSVDGVVGDDVSDVKVDMRRPMARFHFITTDLEEFSSRVNARNAATGALPPMTAPQAPDPQDYRVVVRYTGFMPSAYNLLTDKPVDSRTGISFDGAVSMIDNSQAELAFDHVLVNGSETSVQVALELYRRSDGQMLSSTGVVDVPLKRGHYTVIKGPLLTTMAGAGLGINPGFNGDFNIEIK